MQSFTRLSRYLQTILLGAAFLLLFFTQARTQTKPIEGIRENIPKVHALVNARIVQGPDRVIEKGVIILKKIKKATTLTSYSSGYRQQ